MNLSDFQATYHTTASSVKAQALTAHYPSNSEPALIHPFTNSIVKLRDNGMIDIFTDGDNGIRIDPASKTINIMGGAIKEHGGTKSAWLKSYNSQVDRDWTVKAGGNVNVTAKGSATVQSSGAMTLKSGGTMTIQSGGHMRFSAPSIDID